MIANIPLKPVSQVASKAFGVKRRMRSIDGSKGKTISYVIDKAKFGYLVHAIVREQEKKEEYPVRFETTYRTKTTDDPAFDDCMYRTFVFLEDRTNNNEMWQPKDIVEFTKLENIAKKICRYEKNSEDKKGGNGKQNEEEQMKKFVEKVVMNEVKTEIDDFIVFKKKHYDFEEFVEGMTEGQFRRGKEEFREFREFPYWKQVVRDTELCIVRGRDWKVSTIIKSIIFCYFKTCFEEK